MTTVRWYVLIYGIGLWIFIITVAVVKKRTEFCLASCTDIRTVKRSRLIRVVQGIKVKRLCRILELLGCIRLIGAIRELV